ncbi:MAG: hypothetical protein WBB25_04755 [Sulfitobacter sp.]
MSSNNTEQKPQSPLPVQQRTNPLFPLSPAAVRALLALGQEQTA